MTQTLLLVARVAMRPLLLGLMRPDGKLAAWLVWIVTYCPDAQDLFGSEKG